MTRGDWNGRVVGGGRLGVGLCWARGGWVGVNGIG